MAWSLGFRVSFSFANINSKIPQNFPIFLTNPHLVPKARSPQLRDAHGRLGWRTRLVVECLLEVVRSWE